MSKWQALVDQVRLRSEQLIEAQFRVEADSESDHPQPEPRHRVVVAFGVAVVGGETTDPARNDLRCLFETETLDLNPGQPQVIAVMEALVGKLVGVKSCYKRFIGRCDAR
jgi:hypothetical protein